MKTRTSPFAAAAMRLAYTVAAATQQAQPNLPDRVVATIDAQQTAEAVSKYEFGMFNEHIRTLTYRSLWDEMLDDRKFYFPISSQEPTAPPQQQGNGPFRKEPRRRG